MYKFHNANGKFGSRVSVHDSSWVASRPVINPAAMNWAHQFSLCWNQFSLGWEVNYLMGGEWAGSDFRCGASLFALSHAGHRAERNPALGQLQVGPQRGNHSLTRLLRGDNCSAALSIKLIIEMKNYCGQRVVGLFIFWRFVESCINSLTEVNAY